MQNTITIKKSTNKYILSNLTDSIGWFDFYIDEVIDDDNNSNISARQQKHNMKDHDSIKKNTNEHITHVLKKPIFMINQIKHYLKNKNIDELYDPSTCYDIGKLHNDHMILFHDPEIYQTCILMNLNIFYNKTKNIFFYSFSTLYVSLDFDKWFRSTIFFLKSSKNHKWLIIQFRILDILLSDKDSDNFLSLSNGHMVSLICYKNEDKIKLYLFDPNGNYNDTMKNDVRITKIINDLHRIIQTNYLSSMCDPNIESFLETLQIHTSLLRYTLSEGWCASIVWYMTSIILLNRKLSIGEIANVIFFRINQWDNYHQKTNLVNNALQQQMFLYFKALMGVILNDSSISIRMPRYDSSDAKVFIMKFHESQEIDRTQAFQVVRNNLINHNTLNERLLKILIITHEYQIKNILMKSENEENIWKELSLLFINFCKNGRYISVHQWENIRLSMYEKGFVDWFEFKITLYLLHMNQQVNSFLKYNI